MRSSLPATASACSWLPTYHDMGLVGGMLKPMFYRPAERVDVADGLPAEAVSLAAGDHASIA